jgi:hypothetical protein
MSKLPTLRNPLPDDSRMLFHRSPYYDAGLIRFVRLFLCLVAALFPLAGQRVSYA